MPGARKKKGNDRQTEAVPRFPFPEELVNQHEAERDAHALLSLFYFRRILDHQAISLVVRHFHPLTDFFNRTESELRAFFANFRHLRGVVDAAQLASRTSKAAAAHYADKQLELMTGRYRGTLITERHPAFAYQLNRSRYPIDWLFCHPSPGLAMASPVVAIVGSRQSTSEQLDAAREVAEAVGRLRGTVITGLATGADGAAHSAARDTEASIIAVLGTGVAKPYPPEHAHWVRELIAGRGTVLSESPPDYSATESAFVLRNRIVAALADVVVAVSGKYLSGTSHTIRFAADVGVPVVSADPSPSSGMSKLVSELGGQVIGASDVMAGRGREDL